MPPVMEAGESSFRLIASTSVPDQLTAVLQALLGLGIALAQAIFPWTPLLLWVAFWLFAVNWQRLVPILMKGGLIGVVLIALTVILAWSSIAEPAGGVHRLFGLHVHNLVGKTVYVTGLAVIAAICGSVQLNSSWGPHSAPDADGELAGSPASDHH